MFSIRSRRMSLSGLCFAFFLGTAASMAHAADAAPEIRLYALDCGRIDLKDEAAFSDTGEYDGKSGSLQASCFVIRHPKGVLLWDTGLGAKVAESKGGVDAMGGAAHLSEATSLADQLKLLKLAPADVTYVAFSHFHFDHTGDANLFGSSTWIINKAELAWAQSQPTPFGVDPSAITGSKAAKTQMIDGDYDVFGDGSVRILKAPGHTPGHQALEVKLHKSGVVILSGDLYHTQENRKESRVPVFNVDRADTLASINRIEKIVKNTHARFVIQHSLEDFAALPKLPAFLD